MLTKNQYKHVDWKYKLKKKFTYTLNDSEWGRMKIDPYSREHTSQYLSVQGKVLTIKRGYAWDGATGAFDTANTMRATLVHDALYQIIRTSGQSDDQKDDLREQADEEMIRILKADGMSVPRRWGWYIAVRAAGHKFV